MGVMRCGPIAILMSVLVASSVQQNGRQVANCVWEYDDGRILDLTSIGNTDGTARWNNKSPLDVNADPNTYTINPCYGFTLGTECQDVTVCRSSNYNENVAAASSGRMYYSEAEHEVLLEYNHTDPSDPDLLYISRFQSACNGAGEAQIVVQGIQSSTPNQVIHRFILLLPCVPIIIAHTQSADLTPQPIKTAALAAGSTAAATIGLPSTVTKATLVPPPVSKVTLVPPPVSKVTIIPPPVTKATIGPPPVPETHHLTGGAVLCIIFVCCVCGYFLIGSLYMLCFSGARGIEIIPHIHFWLDLPNLIMEGFFFLFSCCGNSQIVSSSGQDYDKI